MELDFSNDTIEKLLLKRLLSDKSWMAIVNNVHECLYGKAKRSKSIFHDKCVAFVAKVATAYFAKHGKSPNA